MSKDFTATVDYCQAATRDKDGGIAVEQIQQLFDWLTGAAETPPHTDDEPPTEHRFYVGLSPKMSPGQAESLIWWLQEVLRCVPEHYGRCSWCGNWYDSYASGCYLEADNEDDIGWCREFTGDPNYVLDKRLDGTRYCDGDCRMYAVRNPEGVVAKESVAGDEDSNA